jgi:dienelactone hydrolase
LRASIASQELSTAIAVGWAEVTSWHRTCTDYGQTLTWRFAMHVGVQGGGGSTVASEFAQERPVAIPHDGGFLAGSVAIPAFPAAVILIANDRGCSRQAASKRALARVLREAGFATVMVDLLTPDDQDSQWADRMRQNAAFLAQRIEAAHQWIRQQPGLAPLPIALLGEDGAAAAALLTCAAHPHDYLSAVACSPRPDLAGFALELVETPVLLVAAEQAGDIAVNRATLRRLHGPRDLRVLPFAWCGGTEARSQLAREASEFILRQLRHHRSG